VRTLEEGRLGVGGAGPLMVIGGAEIYRLCLLQAVRIHLTLVHTKISDGDTFFSAWRDPEWKESNRDRHEADEKNSYAYSYLTLDRVRRSAAP
jgi:dihydrofolate reductase